MQSNRYSKQLTLQDNPSTFIENIAADLTLNQGVSKEKVDLVFAKNDSFSRLLAYTINLVRNSQESEAPITVDVEEVVAKTADNEISLKDFCITLNDAQGNTYQLHSNIYTYKCCTQKYSFQEQLILKEQNDSSEFIERIAQHLKAQGISEESIDAIFAKNEDFKLFLKDMIQDSNQELKDDEAVAINTKIAVTVDSDLSISGFCIKIKNAKKNDYEWHSYTYTHTGSYVFTNHEVNEFISSIGKNIPERLKANPVYFIFERDEGFKESLKNTIDSVKEARGRYQKQIAEQGIVLDINAPISVVVEVRIDKEFSIKTKDEGVGFPVDWLTNGKDTEYKRHLEAKNQSTKRIGNNFLFLMKPSNEPLISTAEKIYLYEAIEPKQGFFFLIDDGNEKDEDGDTIQNIVTHELPPSPDLLALIEKHNLIFNQTEKDPEICKSEEFYVAFCRASGLKKMGGEGLGINTNAAFIERFEGAKLVIGPNVEATPRSVLSAITTPLNSVPGISIASPMRTPSFPMRIPSGRGVPQTPMSFATRTPSGSGLPPAAPLSIRAVSYNSVGLLMSPVPSPTPTAGASVKMTAPVVAVLKKAPALPESKRGDELLDAYNKSVNPESSQVEKHASLIKTKVELKLNNKEKQERFAGFVMEEEEVPQGAGIKIHESDSESDDDVSELGEEGGIGIEQKTTPSSPKVSTSPSTLFSNLAISIPATADLAVITPKSPTQIQQHNENAQVPPMTPKTPRGVS